MRNEKIFADLRYDLCLRTWIWWFDNKPRDSLGIRAQIVFHWCFLPLVITTSVLHEWDYRFTFVNKSDLLVANVVLNPLHIDNTSTLFNSYPSFRVLIPCYCRTWLNANHYEESVFLLFRLITHSMQGPLHSVPLDVSSFQVLGKSTLFLCPQSFAPITFGNNC